MSLLNQYVSYDGCMLNKPNQILQEISVRQWSGRPGFNPRSDHTKDFKNGTWYLLA